MISPTSQHLGLCAQTNSSRWFQGVFRRMLTVHAIWRERRALNAMDHHRLADMGLTKTDAAREASRPAWDAPERWMR
ncbi:hypothetical protein N9L47_03135 [Rhodobacteraceae bacterium]|nr:hypothetical protein [Paracoccaceae bacterium]